MSELSDWKRIVLPDELAVARAQGKAEGIAEVQGALEAARSTIAQLESERDQLTEQLAIRSESGMAKDMQEVMRINNELNARITELEAENEEHRNQIVSLQNQMFKERGFLTAERQRRESAEAAAKMQLDDSVSGLDGEQAIIAHFSRYAHYG